MFDYQYHFEELPIRIEGKPVAFVSGVASLEHDPGYGFVVVGIDVELVDGEGVIRLNERCDDPAMVKWFRELAAELMEDTNTQERFDEALADYQQAA